MAVLQTQIASAEEENKVLETKANDAVRLALSLQALEAKVEQLEQPWWKKIIGASKKPEGQFSE